MSSYIIFCMDVRPIVEHEYPMMSPKNVSREVAKRWKILNDTTKQLYKKKALQDRKQYLIETLKRKIKTDVIEEEEEEDEEDDYVIIKTKEICNSTYLIFYTFFALFFFFFL